MIVTKKEMQEQIKKTKDALRPDSRMHTGFVEMAELIRLTVPYVEAMVKRVEKRYEEK